ncbi:hypothetical protein [Salinispora arenicola]|uniref:hypothetical protein n=1 Tax=Salinispora arenicola TaxID=168697 RepID=UPI00036C3299|nr:hypothetical protein [Salinispora arenicola]
MDDGQPQESPVVSEFSREPEGTQDDDGGPIDPGALRADPDVAEELFGARYVDTTTWAPTQFGTHNTMNNYYGKKARDPIIDNLAGIEGMLKLYVPTDADVRLGSLLAERPAVCLIGPRNSGRFSTACAALARRHAPDRVYEVVLPAGMTPERLTDYPNLVAQNSGFVLRLGEENHVAVMRKLAPIFRIKKSCLLLIKEAQPRQSEQPGGEVSHQPPDPIAVFDKHLGTPPIAVRMTVENCRAEVEKELKATYGPKECMALASAIRKERPENSDALRIILERSQPKRRELAATILLPAPDAPAARRRASQHERAFRLSYAVFRRRPLHYVFEAADLLLREIDSAALRPEWGNMALQHPVQQLLGDQLKRDWLDAREPGTERTGASRTARIRDPGLRGAIIDVAWHDFDGTRRSVLNWLDLLVKQDDDVMQRAAAEAAGLLADLDFARVHKVLIDRWAKSPRAAVRQAAAWALTYSEKGGNVAPKVRAKLREWCSGEHKYQHDTAARVYASGLEQPFLAWSMLDLARIAEDKMQEPRQAIAEAVNQLYRPERARWILDELAGWPPAAPFRVHVVRAVLALTARMEPTSPDGRPDLLQRIIDGQVDIERLSELWRNAFFDSAHAPEAATALATWIRCADGNDDLRTPVVALLDAIITTPANRRRIAFYLTRNPELCDGIPEWLHLEGWMNRGR